MVFYLHGIAIYWLKLYSCSAKRDFASNTGADNYTLSGCAHRHVWVCTVPQNTFCWRKPSAFPKSCQTLSHPLLIDISCDVRRYKDAHVPSKFIPSEQLACPVWSLSLHAISVTNTLTTVILRTTCFFRILSLCILQWKNLRWKASSGVNQDC